MCPDVDNLVVALGVGDETHAVVVHHFLYLAVTLVHILLFLSRNDDVTKVERKSALKCHAITHVLDIVEELG